MTIQIYDVCGRGLGDLWASINHFAHHAEKTGSPLNISKFVKSNGLNNLTDEWVDCKQIMTEIIDSLDIDKKISPIVVDDIPNSSLGIMSCWMKPYFKTKIIWQKRDTELCSIAYQFDGRY
jgi:type III secretory pathway lipoprotein EscJ